MSDQVKINAMLELERRGALPPEKLQVLGELRRRGMIGSAARNAGRGTVRDLIETPPEIEFYRRVMKNPREELESGLLRGQLPLLGSVVGGIGGGLVGALPGSALGAGAGGGIGLALQNMIRQSTGIDRPQGLVERSKDVGKEALTAALLDLTGGLVLKGAGAVAKPIARSIETRVLPARIRGAIESVPGIGGFVKGAREVREASALESFRHQREMDRAVYQQNKESAREAFDALQQSVKAEKEAAKRSSLESLRLFPEEIFGVGKRTAAPALKDATEAAFASRTAAIEKAVAPALMRFGGRRVSVEPVRKLLVDEMQRVSTVPIIDESGNILMNEVERIRVPETRRLVTSLIEYTRDLSRNPTLNEVNKIRRELQRLANFGSANRSAEDKVYGSLSREMKEVFYDSLERIDQKASARIRSAREKFSEAAPILDVLGRLTRGTPEQSIEASRRILRGSFIDEAIVKIPETKNQIAGVVANDLIRNVTNPKQLTRRIDEIGRVTVRNLFGEKGYEALVRLEKKSYSAFEPVTSERFVYPAYNPPKMPKQELGKFYQGILKKLESFENVDQGKITALFNALGQTIRFSAGGNENGHPIRQ